jgi:PIN domain nuclease of toxin-antitoxin system
LGALTVRLLLDTCAFIWLTQEPMKLGEAARSAINERENSLHFSHASVWEIHLKHLSGKLSLPTPPRFWIPEQIAAWNLIETPILLDAIQYTSDLPAVHRDPFDRLLVAQAINKGLTILTPDRFFMNYGVPVIW